METPGRIIQPGCREVRRLYIAPGHNFFGRHGQPPAENLIVEMAQIECVAGRGLRGDRFFDFKGNYKGQITFFAWETYEAICLALLPDAAYEATVFLTSRKTTKGRSPFSPGKPTKRFV